MRREIKDRLKKDFFLIYRLATRAGVHILPAHYYSSEPNVIELEKTLDLWANPSSMVGIDVDLDEQSALLGEVARPFQAEYVGNRTYKEAVGGAYGPGYGYVEAQLLHAVVRHFKPTRIVEIGSGVSTYCSRAAALLNEAEGGRSCQITCVEPFPSRPLRDMAAAPGGGVRLVAEQVQRVGHELFAGLGENDVLFVDSSHVVKAGSDVNHIILEVLPRLKTGVVVHFHDIYFPYDYQRDLLHTFLHNNETSLLKAFLTFNERFRILFCLSHLHYERPEVLKELFPEYRPQSGKRGLRDADYDPANHFPSSIWLRVC